MNKLLLGGSLAVVLAAGAAVAAPYLPKSNGPVSVAELQQRSAERFKRLDANGDGSVTKAEMESGRGQWAAKRGEHGGHRGDLFGRADTDHNGVVTRAEFDAAIAQRAAHRDGGRQAKLSEVARKQRPDQIFKRLDANGDGNITKAEAETARAHFQERRGDRREQRGDNRFDRLDTDHNGTVSLAEFNARGAERINRLDANHDGQVSPEEFDAARAAFRASHGQRR